MITKEELKKEVDNLPESLLEEVYALLKEIIGRKKKTHGILTPRDFHGKLDNSNIRKAAYE